MPKEKSLIIRSSGAEYLAFIAVGFQFGSDRTGQAA